MLQMSIFTIRQLYLADFIKECSQKILWLLHVKASEKDKCLQWQLLLRETEAQTVLAIAV